MLTSTTSCCTYLYKHVHTFLFTNLYVDINYGRVQPANQANLQIQCTKQVCNHDDDEDDNNDDDDDDDEDDDDDDDDGDDDDNDDKDDDEICFFSYLQSQFESLFPYSVPHLRQTYVSENWKICHF